MGGAVDPITESATPHLSVFEVNHKKKKRSERVIDVIVTSMTSLTVPWVGSWISLWLTVGRINQHWVQDCSGWGEDLRAVPL